MRLLHYSMEHRADYPWQFVTGSTCTLRLRCNEPVRSINVVFGDPFWFLHGDRRRPNLHTLPVEDKKTFLGDTFYSVTLEMETRKLRYHFEIVLENGETVFLSETGVTEPLSEEFLRAFQVPYVYPAEHYAAPAWARNIVWYQIFPDRFSRDNESTEEFVPTRKNRFGGTLRGIEKHIPYLKSLGVQGVYLNPIFQSPSNHRYDTANYARIDPELGTEENFASLVGALHENGMRVMLDGVYNHASWQHPFWQDVLKNGEKSAYFDWFCGVSMEVLRGKTSKELTADVMRGEEPFESFAFAADMPKWNTENPAVQDYLIGTAAEWTRKYGVDAWRLDVPDEVSFRFLEHFKKRIRETNPEAYIIGEIWQKSTAWLRAGVFDGAMDYPLYFAIRDFAMKRTDGVETFAERIKDVFLSAPDCVRPRQLAFCGNHDIPRPLTVCGGDTDRLAAALFLQMLLGGAVSIYYGDELGMSGGEDPANRGAMAWGEQSDGIKPLYISMIRFKEEHRGEMNVTEMRVQDGVLRLTFSGGDYMAFIAEPGGEKCFAVPDGMHLRFGNAQLSRGYALFERK